MINFAQYSKGLNDHDMAVAWAAWNKACEMYEEKLAKSSDKQAMQPQPSVDQVSPEVVRAATLSDAELINEWDKKKEFYCSNSDRSFIAAVRSILEMQSIALRMEKPNKEGGARIKDHEIRQVVNDLRDIAVIYYSSQQLRERIAHVILSLLQVVVPSEVQAVEYIDQWGCKHTLSIAEAARQLKDFEDAWPGGLDEIESSITQFKRRLQAVQAVPEGWKLVPIEPTDYMCRQAPKGFISCGTEASYVYRVMLSAAPEPDQKKGES